MFLYAFVHSLAWSHKRSTGFIDSRGPDAVVDKAEVIPLRRGLGLEIPEDPACSLIATDIDLRADIICRGLLKLW